MCRRARHAQKQCPRPAHYLITPAWQSIFSLLLQLSLSYYSVTGFVVTPTYSTPLAVRRSNVMVTAEDEAKAAWLAKLDFDGYKNA